MSTTARAAALALPLGVIALTTLIVSLLGPVRTGFEPPNAPAPDELVGFFHEHRTELERIASLLIARPEVSGVRPSGIILSDPNLWRGEGLPFDDERLADFGIDIDEALEHRTLIDLLGAYLVSRGNAYTSEAMTEGAVGVYVQRSGSLVNGMTRAFVFNPTLDDVVPRLDLDADDDALAQAALLSECACVAQPLGDDWYILTEYR